MSVNNVTNQFSAVLIDKNNVDIIALNESLEAVFNFTYSCICGLKKNSFIDPVDKVKMNFLTFINNHKVCMTIFVDFTNSTE